MNIEQLKTLLVSKQDEKTRIEERLKSPTISDSTVRELIKNKNELVADIQELEIKIKEAEQKYLNQSLNKSFEL